MCVIKPHSSYDVQMLQKAILDLLAWHMKEKGGPVDILILIKNFYAKIAIIVCVEKYDVLTVLNTLYRTF